MFWLGLTLGVVSGMIGTLLLVGICAASGRCSRMEEHIPDQEMAYKKIVHPPCPDCGGHLKVDYVNLLSGRTEPVYTCEYCGMVFNHRQDKRKKQD